jgi:type II secretory pathway component HofQ
MSYIQYGISPELVERAKQKLKNPEIKERIKMIMNGVTKLDLQDRAKVKKLLVLASKAMGESLTAQQQEGIVTFIIAQKIDPKNTFHLLKLWSMFR